MTVLPGSEIQVTDSAAYREDVEAGRYCHLADGRDFTLLEFPWEQKRYPADAIELVQWLRDGLNRLEIESIKTRGVDQLLEKLRQALLSAAPPDLEATALAVGAGWSSILNEETAATAEILLNTLEPYKKEIEHYFTLQGQRRFRGLMAAYLHLITQSATWAAS